MTELDSIFNHLGLTQYLQNFVDEGFDTWETVLYITESDLDVLKVKLGHRRRLQREIAKARGISYEQLVASYLPSSANEEARPAESDERSETRRIGPKVPIVPSTSKRKYRRHPKSDEFAPERPPSAYVIFSNKVREDLRSLNLSFTEIAKRVGEKWQTLTPEEREPYESQAAAAKEGYNAELAKYKKTDEYKEYCNYLQEFKQRNAAVNTDGKRPKLDTEPSNASSASTGSLPQAEGSTATYDLFRHDSINSHLNSPPNTQNLAPPLQGHGLTPGFRGGPSPSMQLPPLSRSLGPVLSLVTAGQLGTTAIVESGARGVGPFRSQVYPIITTAETKESLRAPTLPPIKTESTMSPPIGVFATNARRSMNAPPSFLRKDTTGTSQTASSRSANFSSHGSHESSTYSPITPFEEGKPSRALILPSILAAQSSGDSEGSSDRASMYASSPPSSTALAQSIQPSNIPSPQMSYNTPSPSERTLMQGLSIGTRSPDQRTLRSRSRGLQQTTQASTTFLSPAQTAQQPQVMLGKRDRGISDSPPDPNSDPLSILAYAGRIVDRDARKPP